MPDKTNEIIVADSALPVEVTTASIQQMIYTIRGQQVMLDFDLAEIYLNTYPTMRNPNRKFSLTGRFTMPSV